MNPESTCWFCDGPLKGVIVHRTTLGKPICQGCDTEIEQAYQERQRDNLKALFSLFDPCETRSSDLLRTARPNLHA